MARKIPLLARIYSKIPVRPCYVVGAWGGGRTRSPPARQAGHAHRFVTLRDSTSPPTGSGGPHVGHPRQRHDRLRIRRERTGACPRLSPWPPHPSTQRNGGYCRDSWFTCIGWRPQRNKLRSQILPTLFSRPAGGPLVRGVVAEACAVCGDQGPPSRNRHVSPGRAWTACFVTAAVHQNRQATHAFNGH